MSRNYFAKATKDVRFEQEFKAELIKDFNHLKEVIEKNEDKKMIAFDTETTGLTFFRDKIVGFSFSFDGYSGYYVPLRHTKGDNLPIESFKWFYEEVLLKKVVLMFNSNFDCFMIQGEGCDPFAIRKFDCMVIIYNMDTGALVKNLKFSADWYLGRKAPTFEETVMQQQIVDANKLESTLLVEKTNELDQLIRIKLDYTANNVKNKNNKHIFKQNDTNISLKKKEIKEVTKVITNLKTKHQKHINFQDITPEQAYFYASCDTANTFEIFNKYYNFMAKECPVTIRLMNGKEASILSLDNHLVNAMIYYHQNPIYINSEKMKKLCIELQEDLERQETEIFEFFGYPFNLDSTHDLARALLSKNISTESFSEKKPGNMLVNKQVLEKVKHPIVDKIIARNSTSTQLTNYASKFTEVDKGYVSYSCLQASTGRILSGNSGGKNEFFLNLNFQNLTKPKVILYRAIHKTHRVFNEFSSEPIILDYRFIEVKKDEYIPKRDEHGEIMYKKDNSNNFVLDDDGNKIPIMIPGLMILNGEEVEDTLYIVEGPSKKRNIRSAVTTENEDEWYFISIDYSSEELALAGILSGEPNYLEPYRNQEDIHARTAIAMWGLENYTPEKRKYAKILNFALIYGGSVYTLVNGIKMDPKIAEEAFALFWKGLSVLKRWQDTYLRNVRNNPLHQDRKGTGYTYFGRPRRFPDIFSESFKEMKKAEREALNIPIQGTAGDIIRIDLVNLFSEIWEKDRSFENEIRFVGTVHDEIDLAVRRDQFYKWLPKLREIIEVKFPEREITLRCEFEIGTNFGYTFAFEQDENGIMHPKKA